MHKIQDVLKAGERVSYHTFNNSKLQILLLYSQKAQDLKRYSFHRLDLPNLQQANFSSVLRVPYCHFLRRSLFQQMFTQHVPLLYLDL